MSITVIGALSRREIQPSTDSVPRTVDSPQLPGDVLHEIFKHAHEDSPTSLLPVLRASSLCYASAVPLVYRTVYLNRATIRPLMRETRSRWENGKWICHKRKALAKADKLVIDDIAMLFDEVYDSALQSFISSMVLANVSKITFSQGKSMKWIKEYDGRTYDQMMYRGLETSRAGPFSTVVPCRTKDVCIRFPPRGDFQRKTSPRIMEFIGFFSGKTTIRIHQSINDRYFTFNTIEKAKGVYSYYPDPSGIPARLLLFRHFQPMLDHQIWRLGQVTCGRWEELYTQFKAILDSDDNPEDKLEAAKNALRDPCHQPQPVDRDRWQLADIYESIEHLFSEMVAALDGDGGSACPCCGEKGSPLNT